MVAGSCSRMEMVADSQSIEREGTSVGSVADLCVVSGSVVGAGLTELFLTDAEGIIM